MKNKQANAGESSNGRTRVSEARYPGSNPGSPTNLDGIRGTQIVVLKYVVPTKDVFDGSDEEE